VNPKDRFSSRWAIIAVGLGMAVGTGNLWRFPRVATQNGGGAFLIAWMLFMVLWSLPLLNAEFGLGRDTRRGPIGAFSATLGKRFSWMGGFVVATSLMIMSYYSVITGWTLKYFLVSLSIESESNWTSYWQTYSASVWQPIGFQVLVILLALAVVTRGVIAGIERVNKVLIPALFCLLIIAVGGALNLDGSEKGLAFLFLPRFEDLLSYQIWLEALTQSAWSTGAGWGLMLTYACYVKVDEDVVGPSVAIGLGNNLASILAGTAIVAIVFSLLTVPEAMEVMASGNTGMTFIWLPELFQRMPGGQVFLPIFFLALFFAALSSLIAMIELGVKTLIDRGYSRSHGALLIGLFGTLCGIPSAVNLAVFENQDWVWGLALMICGLFVSLASSRGSQVRVTDEEPTVQRKERRGWVEVLLIYLIPLQFSLMFGWWIYQAVFVFAPNSWWNLFSVNGLGTCLLQWGLVLAILRYFNRELAEENKTRKEL